MTKSPDETKRIGHTIGKVLKGGNVISLNGDLGCGKTLITKGIASGLGVDENKVKSPSFTLINQYAGLDLEIYHIDLYRLDDPYEEMANIDSEEIFFGDGVAIVEWADKISNMLPEDRLNIKINYIDEYKREFIISTVNEKFFSLINCLRTIQ